MNLERVCRLHLEFSQVCLEPNCNPSAMVCPNCLPLHSTHRLVAISEFPNLLSQLLCNPAPLACFSSLLSTLQEVRLKCIVQLASLKQQLIKTVDKLEREIMRYFQRMQVRVEEDRVRFVGLSKQGTGVINQWDIEELQFRMALQVQRFVLAEPIVIGIGQRVSQIEAQIKNQAVNRQKSLDYMSSLLNSLYKDFTQNLTEINLTWPSPHFPQPLYKTLTNNPDCSPLRWSASLKHSNIKITGTMIQRQMPQTLPPTLAQQPIEIQRRFLLKVCCLTNWKLVENNKVYRWKIKIVSHDPTPRLQSEIMVGISSEKSACNRSFSVPMLSTVGHGQYLLTSRGYIYTSDKQLNGICWQAFDYTAGDILKLQYDTLNQQLQITKNMLKKYTLKVQPASYGDWYRPCAYLYLDEERIQISSI